MSDDKERLRQLEQQDREIRKLVEAQRDESTPNAVNRVVQALFRANLSWGNAAAQLAKEFGFKWPDNHIGFEIPLAEAWRKDREKIAALEAHIKELETGSDSR